MTRSGVLDTEYSTPDEVPLPAPLKRGRRLRVVLLIAAVATVLGALALPFAPVQVNRPTVSWPVDPHHPTSTLLGLTASAPRSLDAEFDCAAVRTANATGTGRTPHTVFATVDPARSPADADGLRLLAIDGTVSANVGTRVVFTDPLPRGSCVYRIRTVDGALQFSRGTTILGTAPLPQVDVLATAVTAHPGDGFGVRVGVDDEYNSLPGTAKKILISWTVLCGLATVVLGIVALRTPRALTRARKRFAKTDLLVGFGLVAWLFLCPMTHDDGWMYAMAENARNSGYFGNYYMYHNNAYVPFTWLLQVYSWWSTISPAPVIRRIPTLIFGLITWCCLRNTLRMRGGHLLLLGLVFLCWWTAFDFGTRQEGASAVCSAVTLWALTSACRRDKPALLMVAGAAASLGAIAHPAGMLSGLLLVVALPQIRLMLRRSLLSTLERAAALLAAVAAASVGVLAAFAQGSLADFRRGSQSFGAGEPHPLRDELDRYQTLFGDTALGNYAMRTPVLLLGLALVGFLVLRAFRRQDLPVRLAGWASIGELGWFVVVPTKWTWHFGCLAAVGSVVIVGVAGWARVAWVRASRPRRMASLALLPVLGAVFWLAGQGKNWWADTPMSGVPRAGETALPIPFIVALAVPALVLFVRSRVVAATATLVAVGLSAQLVFLLGGFAFAATRPGYSPWADAVADPLGRRGGEAQALQVADPRDARVLPSVQGTTRADGFAAGGWWWGSPPDADTARSPIWGSARNPNRPASVTTGWLALPRTLSTQAPVITTVSGRTGGPNKITAEFATVHNGRISPVSSRTFAVDEDDIGWRDVVLTDGSGLGDGVRLVRLHARSTRDWFAFSMPAQRSMIDSRKLLPSNGKTLIDWQLNWLYPGQRQPVVANGIVTPVDYTLGHSFGPVGSRHDIRRGGTWSWDNGGMLGPQVNASTVVRLTTRLSTEPNYPLRTVYRFSRPWADSDYRLTTSRQTASGWRL